MKNLTNEEKKELMQTLNRKEWDNIMGGVLERCGGYPIDWKEKMIDNDLMKSIFLNWKYNVLNY